ncbi:MAG: type 4a pilus biogenesis protein PilO [Patescibacteria group bacterium]|nr:type 4a pilus biogenesis protein PilO [Patescibacteria group bacterium]
MGFFRLDLKKRITISLIGFFLFIFVIIYFVIFPSVRDIRNIKNEIQEQRLELERKYVKGQSLKKMTEKLKRAEEKIHVLDQVFIKEDAGLEFVTALEEAAGKDGVNQKINLLSLSPVENEFYKMVPLQVSSQGGASQQMNYLVDLETLDYYVNIKLLELSSGSRSAPTGDSGSAANVNLFITADTYWRGSAGN